MAGALVGIGTDFVERLVAAALDTEHFSGQEVAFHGPGHKHLGVVVPFGLEGP